MSVGDAVKTVVQDVGEQVADLAGGAAKQVAKTPLNILEEILSGKPASDTGRPGESEKSVEKDPGGSPNDPQVQAQLQQKIQEDKVVRGQKLQQHRQMMQGEQQFFQQKVAQEQQQKKMEEQQKQAQKKFEIQQLERKKQENVQVKNAIDASNPEKRGMIGAE